MTLEKYATIVADGNKTDMEVVDAMFKVANPSAKKIWELFNQHRPKVFEALKQIALERFVEDLQLRLDEKPA